MKRKITGENFFLSNALHVLFHFNRQHDRPPPFDRRRRVKDRTKKNFLSRRKIFLELRKFCRPKKRKNKISSISYATRRYALRSLTFIFFRLARAIRILLVISRSPHSCHQPFRLIHEVRGRARGRDVNELSGFSWACFDGTSTPFQLPIQCYGNNSF